MAGDPSVLRYSPALGRCPICGEAAVFQPIYCPRCKTPHHEECWRYNEGCAIYGCRPTLTRRDPSPPARRRPPFRRTRPSPLGFVGAFLQAIPPLLWRAIGVAVFLAGLLAGAFFASLAHAPTQVYLIPTLICLAGTKMFFGANALSHALGRIGSSPPPEAPSDEALEMRLAMNPENVDLVEELAFRAFADGRYERARELYEQALSMRPKHQRNCYQLGLIAHRLGDREAAKEAFGWALSLSPETEHGARAQWWLHLLERLDDGPAPASDDGDDDSGATPRGPVRERPLAPAVRLVRARREALRNKEIARSLARLACNPAIPVFHATPPVRYVNGAAGPTAPAAAPATARDSRRSSRGGASSAASLSADEKA